MKKKKIEIIVFLIFLVIFSGCEKAPNRDIVAEIIGNDLPENVQTVIYKGKFQVEINADIIAEKIPLYYYKTLYYDYSQTGLLDCILSNFFENDFKRINNTDIISFVQKDTNGNLKKALAYNSADYTLSYMDYSINVNNIKENDTKQDELNTTNSLLRDFNIQGFEINSADKIDDTYQITYIKKIDDVPVFFKDRTSYEGVVYPRDKITFELAEDNSIISFSIVLTNLSEEKISCEHLIDLNTAIEVFEKYGVASLSSELEEQNSITVTSIELMYMNTLYSDKTTFYLIPIWNFKCEISNRSSDEISEIEIQINAIDATLIY